MSEGVKIILNTRNVGGVDFLPATVTNPPDLAVSTEILVVTSMPFHINRNPAKVGRHAIVLDHCYEGDCGENVIEYSLAGRAEK